MVFYCGFHVSEQTVTIGSRSERQISVGRNTVAIGQSAQCTNKQNKQASQPASQPTSEGARQRGSQPASQQANSTTRTHKNDAESVVLWTSYSHIAYMFHIKRPAFESVDHNLFWFLMGTWRFPFIGVKARSSHRS